MPIVLGLRLWESAALTLGTYLAVGVILLTCAAIAALLAA